LKAPWPEKKKKKKGKRKEGGPVCPRGGKRGIGWSGSPPARGKGDSFCCSGLTAGKRKKKKRKMGPRKGGVFPRERNKKGGKTPKGLMVRTTSFRNFFGGKKGKGGRGAEKKWKKDRVYGFFPEKKGFGKIKNERKKSPQLDKKAFNLCPLPNGGGEFDGKEFPSQERRKCRPILSERAGWFKTEKRKKAGLKGENRGSQKAVQRHRKKKRKQEERNWGRGFFAVGGGKKKTPNSKGGRVRRPLLLQKGTSLFRSGAKWIG